MNSIKSVLENLCWNYTDLGGHTQIVQALNAIAGIVEGMKETKHGDFCGIRPEWRDKENNGNCDCSMPTYNLAISEVVKKIRGE